MPKFNSDPIEPRQSFSHARIKPLVVEKMKRRSGASTVLVCPSCGGGPERSIHPAARATYHVQAHARPGAPAHQGGIR